METEEGGETKDGFRLSLGAVYLNISARLGSPRLGVGAGPGF